jgi:formylglycine-generating enzyme required for sulfatase activity
LPPAIAQEAALKQAGVCSRCHVVQVMEWSASRHTASKVSCQGCHGASAGHVENERNQIKPDRLPKAEAVAGLCATCHTGGCPKTAQKAGCQSCHHVHALADPNDQRLRPVDAPEDKSFAEYQRRMREGESHVSKLDWSKARDSFQSALNLRPGDRRAAMRLRMSERRLHPEMPGFEISDAGFDGESGLPLRVRVPELAMEMILLTGGEFDLGSETLRGSQPVHTVRLEPVYLAARELTQRQWVALGLENPSTHRGDALPVHNISWNDARTAVERLNAKVAGGGFRLPTEAEWEYAARAEGGPLEEVAWYRGNSAIGAESGFREWNTYAPRPAGTKKPNRLGFHDLFGNVAEWCSTLMQPYPYDARDGRERMDAAGMRVIRGSSFTDSGDMLDAALRHADRPARRLPWNGMRVARSVPAAGTR